MSNPKIVEYNVEWCKTHVEHLQACLDKCSNEGWLLHSVVLPHDDAGFYVIMERPVK